MRQFNIFHAAIVLGAIALAASPVHALKPLLFDQPSTNGCSGIDAAPEPSSLLLSGKSDTALRLVERERENRT